MMNTHQDELGALEMELSHLQGEQLCEFLETLIQKIASDSEDSLLESVFEKVADANSLAIWRRENVAFDLRRDEATELLEALSVQLEEESWPERTYAALAETREQLRREVSRTAANL